MNHSNQLTQQTNLVQEQRCSKCGGSVCKVASNNNLVCCNECDQFEDAQQVHPSAESVENDAVSNGLQAAPPAVQFPLRPEQRNSFQQIYQKLFAEEGATVIVPQKPDWNDFKPLADFIRHIGADDLPSDEFAKQIIDWQAKQAALKATRGESDMHTECTYPENVSKNNPKMNTSPPETMTVQEVWEAAGGNPGIKATRQEVIETLQLLDEVCDDSADADPTQDREQAARYRELRDLYCTETGLSVEQYEIELIASLEKKRKASR